MNDTHTRERRRRTPSQFALRTKLREGEYHRQFRKMDRAALERVRSTEALAVTLAMGTIYLALADAPDEFVESERVLYFAGEQTRDGERLTAIQQLAAYVGVSVGTLLKALRWMDAEGIIGYDPYKNGAGIRIFVNLAIASIGKRSEADQKNLPARATPNSAAHTATFDAPFRNSFAVPESFRIEDSAPENSAGTAPPGRVSGEQSDSETGTSSVALDPIGAEVLRANACPPIAVQPESIEATPVVSSGLDVSLVEAAMRAASRAAAETARAAAEQTARITAREIARQQEQTRHWLETSVMPKVARVAQHEAYKIHKHHATARASAERTRADMNVGRARPDHAPATCKPRIGFDETVRMCLTALDLDGPAGVEQTLALMCRGGEITYEDAARARTALAPRLGTAGGISHAHEPSTLANGFA